MVRSYFRRLVVFLAVLSVAIPGTGAFASTDGSTLSQDRGKSTDIPTGGSPVTDPFTGAATYSIPIVVPPGTGGMTPELALTYSSQGPVDSWVGSRWSLGLPSIERSLRRGVPTYNDAIDTFEFSGQDLVPDGVTAGLYHTERESFLRIVREVDGSWTVTRKDGTALRFGTTENSRVQSTTPVKVFQWLLAEQEDVHGNVIQFIYQNGGDAGAQYPHQIIYTLRRSGSGLQSLGVDRIVEFQLESGPRPDTTYNYATGFLRKVSRRLQRVRVLIGADPGSAQLVRSYELEYSQNASHRRSLLSSIGIVGRDGDSLAALKTSFSYDSAGPATGWSSSNAPWTFPSSFSFVDNNDRDAGWRLADVNGDALPDLIKYVADWDQETGDVAFDPDNGVYLNTGTGWVTAPSPAWPLPQASSPLQNPFFAVRIHPASGGVVVQPTGRAVLDATGDGRADFLASTSYLAPFDGDDIVPGLDAGDVAFGLYRSPWWKSRTIDFPTGPRWDALVPAIEGNANYRDHVWFASHGINSLTGSSTLGGNVRFAEMDGDGLPEMVVGGGWLKAETRVGLADTCTGIGSGLIISNTGGLEFSMPSAPASGLLSFDPFPQFTLQFLDDNSLGYNPFYLHCEWGQLGTSVDRFSESLFTLGEDSQGGDSALYETHNDGMREMVDVNGDGLDDQLASYDQFGSYWIWQFPEPTHQQPPIATAEENDAVVRTARINSGGSLLSASSSGWKSPIAFVEIQAEQTQPNDLVPYSLDNGARFADLDGDGRVDLVRRKGGGGSDNKTWLNDGDGVAGSAWVEAAGWVPPFDFVASSSRDRGVRLFDIDGDGMVDVVEARAGTRRVRLNQAEVPDLLTRVTRPDGGTVGFSYLPSTAFSHLGGDDLPDLPMVVQVVHQIAVDDANAANGTQPAVTTYSYADGFFDSSARKFRGFGTVSVTRPDGRVTTTKYRQTAGDAGLPKNILIQAPDGQGGLRDWRYQQFTYTNDSAAPYTILLAGVKIEERDGNGGNRASFSSFEYDEYGNQVAAYEFGEVANASDVDPDDTRVRETIYAPPNLSRYIVDRPAIQLLRQGSLSGPVLSERHLFYDCNPSSCPGSALSQAPPTRGLVTKRVDILGDPVRPDPMTTFAYDEYGNVTSTTDPRANAFEGGGTTTIQYDPTFHAFPAIVTNALGHQRTFSYVASGGCSGVAGAVPHSSGEGLVYEERGPNDLANGASHWLRCYDRFGRIVLERAPGSLAQTTRSYVDLFPASVTERVAASSLAPNGSRTTTTYLDGLGRPIRVASDAAQGRTVTVETIYDPVGRIASETAPFFGAPATKPATTYLYDPLDRTVQRTLPGLSGTRRETTTYAQGRVTSVDANGRTTERLFDPFGNVREVVEHNGGVEYTTTYQYDVRDLLVRVTDHGGNETHIGYDALGRRTSLDDPDTGVTLYEFDSNGNVVRRESATGTFFVWFYDALDRPISRHLNGNTNANVTWGYDTATNGFGLLATRSESVASYQAQAYDLLGRATQESRATDGGSGSVTSFATSYSLDGNLSTRTYPNGRVIQWIRDAKGFLTEIRSDADVYATAIDWDERGRVKSWTAGNSVQTTYSLDASTTRLDRIQVGSLEHLQYGYDAGDRITSITDLFDGTKSRTFTYDDLDRLDGATGPFGANQAPAALFYAYDPIGNLTCKGATSLSGCASGLAMTYPVPGPSAVRPHAPLTIDGVAIQYDAAGNMKNEGNRSFQYNTIGKMSVAYEGGTTAASFFYDGEDDLGQINDYSTGSLQKRWLLAPDFEWNQTTQLAKIHISLGDLRVATETDVYSPSGGGGSCSGVGPAVPVDVDRLLGNLLLVLTLLGLSMVVRSRPRRAWARAMTAVVSGAVLFAVTSFPTPIGVANLDRSYAALQQVEFYHADAIGSSVLVTNEAGALVQRTVYEPFGKAIAPSGGTTNAPEFGFTNQRFIKRAAIYDYGARMYDPKTGRFLQPDSVVPDPSDPQSLNRYSYVRNGPTNRVDPTGNLDVGVYPFYGGATDSSFLYEWYAVESWYNSLSEPQLSWSYSPYELARYNQANSYLYGFGTRVSEIAYGVGQFLLPEDPYAASPAFFPTLAYGVAAGAYNYGRDLYHVMAEDHTNAEVGALIADTFAFGLAGRMGRGTGAARGITNPVPSRLARVIPGDLKPTTLGRPGAGDVFVTAADDIAGLNPAQLAERLTIPQSRTFTVIEFDTPASGLASPVFRNTPGFVGGGRTAGGAREFVLPNGPIPADALIRRVGP